MVIKRFILSVICVPAIFLLTSCNSLLHKNEGIFGKSSNAQAESAAKIDNADTHLADLDQQRLTHIGAWAKGVEHSLDAATNQEPAVTTAQKINERVEELANKPDIAELKQVYNIVDNLLTNLANGQKLLDKKDKEIAALQKEIDQTNADREAAINQFRNLAQDTALQRDQYAATLKQLDSGWGLSAVWYGLKKFAIHIAWAAGIFTVIFIVLRIAAASNPIAGSVFAIFERMGSWVLNIVKHLLPRASSLAGFTPTIIADGYKTTLKNIMDEVLLLENQQKTNPTAPNVTLDQLIVNIEKGLNDQDKANVAEIKQELNWKTI